MLDPTAVWTFASKKPLTKWYGHVHLLSNHVVGQWFCLDRVSGQLKWRRTFLRPNTICGVESGVIVASEMRSDGPWIAAFGCYGISLEDGRHIWTSHGRGLWGRLGRLLDFVPGFTNELRDTPHYLGEGKVFCSSGRVLDLRTGRMLEKISPEIVAGQGKPLALGRRFYDSGIEREHPKVPIGGGLVLRHAQATPGMTRGVLEIVAETEDGKVLWTFSVDLLGRHIDGNFYSYRLAPPFMYLIVSDQPRYKPHPTKKHYLLPNPTHWHLVALALDTGDVAQDFSLGEEKQEECRIEDVDDDGLLIGKSNCELAYFRRRA